jgi:hypothetical protein
MRRVVVRRRHVAGAVHEAVGMRQIT